MFVHASVLAERRRWPGGGVNNGLQWVCSAARSHLSHHMKTVHVGSLLGLSREPRGGVMLLDCWEEEEVCVWGGGAMLFANR